MLEVIKVSKKYRARALSSKGKRIQALKNVSLSISEGEFHSLVGESGSGKSTLAKLILGLDKIDSGEINFYGRSIYVRDKQYRRFLKKNLQVVFQDNYSALNPRMKVGDIVAEPIRNWDKLSYNEEKKIVFGCLERVGLSVDDSNKYPHQFSGGQQKRINIARAIATKPKYIILDEAVSNLDTPLKVQIINLLKELKHEINSSYLFISHDLEIACQVADSISVVYKGEIVETKRGVNSINDLANPYVADLKKYILPDHPGKRKIIM